MKYYDNLRLVIEIQSRLRELTDQEPAGQQRGVPTGAKEGSQQ